jgi:hypothetical protein
MQHVITHIQEKAENSKIYLKFLYIVGASDCTSHDIIKAPKGIGLESHHSKWISSTASGRKITATLIGETVEGSVARCSLQRGILLPHSCAARL